MRSLWFGVLVCAAMFVACSDDDSDFATRPSDRSSSSVCDDCDDGSSSSAKSSSSSAKSSSSATLANPCKTDSTDTCEYGELLDDRDGQTYKTVKIGDQVWMAENLNYAYTGVPYEYTYNSVYTSDSSSWCYDNDSDNCTKYGRLYTWAAAMDSAGTWTTNGKGCGYYGECSPSCPVRGICPEGWHLPDTTEWQTLFDAVGGESTAGKVLKSASGWEDYKGESGNGTDDFGFSALSVGIAVYNGDYYYEGRSVRFWSSTECNSESGCRVTLAHDRGGVFLFRDLKSFGFAVRCLKD